MLTKGESPTQQCSTKQGRFQMAMTLVCRENANIGPCTSLTLRSLMNAIPKSRVVGLFLLQRF